MKPLDEKKNIGSLFDRIAGSYDRLNHLLSLSIDRLWRRRAVNGMQPAEQVLDVAVGTADLAVELVRRNKAERVTGLDLSVEMMKIGANKVRRAGLDDRVCFMHGNALSMPFDDGAFDAVTSAFGVRNFSDLEQGLSEMYRVLHQGGELMVLELSYPSCRVVRWVYDVYFSHVLPVIGRVLSHDHSAYIYLNRSVKHFVWGETFCNYLRQAGFVCVTYTPLSLGICTVYRARK